jgi:hypothetical protein
LLFDPSDDIEGYDDTTNFGPAAFKPALAQSTSALDNDLLIFYGLGERGDLSTSGSKQLMIAVRENITVDMSSGTYEVEVAGEEVWHLEFENIAEDDYSEKLTGAPVVFNGGVYFTTFVEPADDPCDPGWSRIYGLTFQGDLAPNETSLPQPPRGLFRTQTATDLEAGEVHIPEDTQCFPSGSTRCMAYEPVGAQDLDVPIVVRGLTVTLGRTCLAPGGGTGGAAPGTHAADSQAPTLMAQSTSSALSGAGSSAIGGTGAGDGSGLFSIEQKLADPLTENIPLSWAVIDN